MKHLKVILLSAVFFYSAYALAIDGKKIAYISVQFEDSKASDSLLFIHYENLLGHSESRYLPKTEKVTTPDGKGLFRFYIETANKPTYFSFGRGADPYWGTVLLMLDSYLMEPTDSIVIDIRKNTHADNSIRRYDAYFRSVCSYRDYTFSFSGRGYAKYRARYEADVIASLGSRNSGPVITKSGEYNPNNNMDFCLTSSLQILDTYKKLMSGSAYEVLKADFIGKYYTDKINALTTAWQNYWIIKKDSTILKKINYLYKTKSFLPPIVSEPASSVSRQYPGLIMSWTILSQRVNGKEENLYYVLKNTYSGELRDRLLTILILQRNIRQDQADAEKILVDALSTVKTEFCENQLLEVFNMSSRGKPAYNFVLEDTSGQIVKLQDFKKKVVFIDFWFTGCGACKTYYTKVLSKVEKEYEGNPNIVFVSISIDNDKKRWIKSIQEGKNTSIKFINLYTGGAGPDHPVISNYKVMAYPRPLLIGKDGNLYSASNKELRDYASLVQVINKALLE
jgi:thiol-disulfide isomerase/thioredoxin